MPDKPRIPSETAHAIIQNHVWSALEPLCTDLAIAGSLRRGKPTVGDIEIVCIPESGFLTAVYHLADRHAWADYGGQTRKGEKYMGLSIEGVKVEIFTATPENYGYILWLRTGPGEANTFVMSYLKRVDAPNRPHDGYWWSGDAQLITPDEDSIFHLLGIPFIEPSRRDKDTYYRLFSMENHQWGKGKTKPINEQLTLF